MHGPFITVHKVRAAAKRQGKRRRRSGTLTSENEYACVIYGTLITLILEHSEISVSRESKAEYDFITKKGGEHL